VSEPISGVNNVTPTYPVKPVQPSNRDRKSGKRNQDRSPPDTGAKDDDDDQKSQIDEYV